MSTKVRLITVRQGRQMRPWALPVPLAVGSAVVVSHLLIQEGLRRRDSLRSRVAGRPVQRAFVRVLVLQRRNAAAEIQRNFGHPMRNLESVSLAIYHVRLVSGLRRARMM